MVRKIDAWTAEDGSIHATELEAAKADAVAALKTFDMFNHASAMAIVARAREIVPILQQVIDAIPPETRAE